MTPSCCLTRLPLRLLKSIDMAFLVAKHILVEKTRQLCTGGTPLVHRQKVGAKAHWKLEPCWGLLQHADHFLHEHNLHCSIQLKSGSATQMNATSGSLWRQHQDGPVTLNVATVDCTQTPHRLLTAHKWVVDCTQTHYGLLTAHKLIMVC